MKIAADLRCPISRALKSRPSILAASVGTLLRCGKRHVSVVAGAAVFLAAIISASSSAQAQTADISNVSAPASIVGIGATTQSLGYSFTVGNSALTVSSLGVIGNFNLPSSTSPTTQVHQVSIWNSSGTQLATVTVPIGTALTGQFAYVALGSTLTLAANTQYTIEATYSSPLADPLPAFASATTARGLTINAAVDVGGANTFATSDFEGGGPYDDAAFLFSAAPAFWKGTASGSWLGANWTSDAAGTTPTSAPGSATDVTFSATGAAHQGTTTLDQDFTIHSLTDSDTSAEVVISSGTGGPHTLTISGNAGTGITVTTGAHLTINSNVTLGGASDTIEVDGNDVATITGILGGSNGLNKAGTGTLTIGGAANYTGATTILDGTLKVGVNNALPTGTTVTINNAAGTGAALLDLNGHNQTIAGLIFVARENGSTVDVNGGVLTLGGNVSLVDNTSQAGFGLPSNIQDTAGGGALDLGGATRTFNVAGQSNTGDDLEFDVKIQGTGGVVINATPSTHDSSEGGVIFNAANTYTGSTTVAQGRLSTSMPGALPTTTDLILGTVSSALTGDVDLLGHNQTVNSLALATGNTGGTGNFITSTFAGATLTVSSTTTDTAFAGLITGSLSLAKDGAGTTLELDAANTYTGSTAVLNGTIKVGIDNALPTGTTVTINNPTGNGNALLDLNGHNQTIAGLSFVARTAGQSTVDVNGGKLTLTGDVNVVDSTLHPGDGEPSTIQDTVGKGALDLGGAVRTFNIAGQNVGNEDLTVSTVIQNGGVTINALNSSTFHNSAGVNFTAANTYAGGTTITSGYLLANNTSGSATGSGPVMINSGEKLAGNGTVAGLVTLNSGGALEAGQDGVGQGTQGTLHLGSVTWNGGGNVNLELGTTSDQLALTGTLTKGSGSGFTITISDAGGLNSQSEYTLATFASTTFAVGDFTLALPSGFTGSLVEKPTELDLDLAFAASGPVIQNAPPVGTPVIADFTIIGPVTTGGPADNNTINSLIFTPGGTLVITNTLYLTSGNVTTTGGNNSITGGTLFGPNGLHFDVNGNLFIGSTLIGSTTKTGPGALFLDGTLFGNMNVLQGLLGGNGTITGDLYNAATVSPGHSPGRLQVGRNYIQASTGLLQIQIGGRDLSQHDLLSVGGAAGLNGTLEIDRLNNFKLKRNQPVTFLTAGGGVTGRFTTVENGFTSDTILVPTVVYGSNSVSLEAVQGSFEKLARGENLTPNQRAVAGALDTLGDARHTGALFDYLDDRHLGDLPRDFEKISPDQLTSIFTLGVATEKQQSLNLQRRNDDIRSGSSGFTAAGLAINGQSPNYSGGFSFGAGVAGPSGDDGKEVKETKSMAAPVEESRWGAFLSGTGEWVNVSGTDNARGYNLESGGFTLGLDYKFTPNFAMGIMAGYTGSSSDLADHGRIFVNGGELGIYATFYQNAPAPVTPTMSKDSSKEAPAPTASLAKGFYADLAASGGYNSYDTRRAALQGEARGDTDGGELNALLGVGYDFKAGGLTFGPTASFNYTYVGTNTYTEHGSLAPLDIHGGKGESLRSAFGLKASYDWKCGGILIKPEIRASWQHEYGDTAYAFDSSFADGGGSAFTVHGPKLGRDSALLGAGFAIQFNERLSTYFYYDGELGRTNYQSTSVTGGVRVAF